MPKYINAYNIIIAYVLMVSFYTLAMEEIFTTVTIPCRAIYTDEGLPGNNMVAKQNPCKWGNLCLDKTTANSLSIGNSNNTNETTVLTFSQNMVVNLKYRIRQHNFKKEMPVYFGLPCTESACAYLVYIDKKEAQGIMNTLQGADLPHRIFINDQDTSDGYVPKVPHVKHVFTNQSKQDMDTYSKQVDSSEECRLWSVHNNGIIVQPTAIQNTKYEPLFSRRTARLFLSLLNQQSPLFPIYITFKDGECIHLKSIPENGLIALNTLLEGDYNKPQELVSYNPSDENSVKEWTGVCNIIEKDNFVFFPDEPIYHMTLTIKDTNEITSCELTTKIQGEEIKLILSPTAGYYFLNTLSPMVNFSITLTAWGYNDTIKKIVFVSGVTKIQTSDSLDDLLHSTSNNSTQWWQKKETWGLALIATILGVIWYKNAH